MSKTISEIQRQLLGTFFEESTEGLEKLESGLLLLEAGNASEIHEIFRAAHSIKGSAGTFGFASVGALAHAMETVLDGIRGGSVPVTAATTALLLRAVDVVRNMLETARAGGQMPDTGHEELERQLAAAATASASAPAASPSDAAATKAGSASEPASRRHFRITFAPHPGLLETGNDPVRMLRELGRLGSLGVTCDLSRLPTLADLDPTRSYLQWIIELETEAEPSTVDGVFAWVTGDADVAIEASSAAAPAAPEQETAAAPSTPAPTEAGGATARAERDSALGSVRVSVDKIDLLMNMVGELVITQSMLGEIDGDGPIDAQRLARMREGLSQLARNTRSLQESVMRLRSMPIGMVFGRLPRMVHDLAHQLGKQVDLRLGGQTTELDKTVLEKLGDPLVHLVRNSLDHGLELPADRRAAGKPETGIIELRAYHRGSDIVVEISDDGRGLDLGKILARGRERGLVSPDETPSDEALRQLIFAPGFSTADTITDVSGRGVGMDVVRRNVKSLGGDIQIESQPGRGTRISLRLPLTLAIIDGQLIRLGHLSYVLPLLSIVETVEVDRRHVSRPGGRHEIYRLRDQLIPIIDLGQLLGIPSAAQAERLMVIVDAEGQRLGLLVDELLAQQQVVVKSLETNYGRVEGLAGATILGDGAVSFILDAAGIRRLLKGRVGSTELARAA